MNDKNPTDLTPKQAARQEGQKLLYDSLKHLTTLSTGSVLLLATLLEKFFKAPILPALLYLAFLLLIVSSITAFITMLSLSDSIFHFKESSETGSRTGKVEFHVSFWSFVIGILAFVSFAIINFYKIHHPAVPTKETGQPEIVDGSR